MASPSNSQSSSLSQSTQPRCLSCQLFMSKTDPHSNCCSCAPERKCSLDKRCLLCQDLTESEFKAMESTWARPSKRKSSGDSSKHKSKKVKDSSKDQDLQSLLKSMFDNFRDELNSDMDKLEKRVNKTNDAAIIRLRKDLFIKQATTPEPVAARTECGPSDGLVPDGSREGVGPRLRAGVERQRTSGPSASATWGRPSESVSAGQRPLPGSELAMNPVIAHGGEPVLSSAVGSSDTTVGSGPVLVGSAGSSEAFNSRSDPAVGFGLSDITGDRIGSNSVSSGLATQMGFGSVTDPHVLGSQEQSVPTQTRSVKPSVSLACGPHTDNTLPPDDQLIIPLQGDVSDNNNQDIYPLPVASFVMHEGRLTIPAEDSDSEDLVPTWSFAQKLQTVHLLCPATAPPEEPAKVLPVELGKSGQLPPEKDHKLTLPHSSVVDTALNSVNKSMETLKSSDKLPRLNPKSVYLIHDRKLPLYSPELDQDFAYLGTPKDSNINLHRKDLRDFDTTVRSSVDILSYINWFGAAVRALLPPRFQDYSGIKANTLVAMTAEEAAMAHSFLDVIYASVADVTQHQVNLLGKFTGLERSRTLQSVPHLPDRTRDMLYSQPMSDSLFNGKCAEALQSKDENTNRVLTQQLTSALVSQVRGTSRPPRASSTGSRGFHRGRHLQTSVLSRGTGRGTPADRGVTRGSSVRGRGRGGSRPTRFQTGKKHF